MHLCYLLLLVSQSRSGGGQIGSNNDNHLTFNNSAISIDANILNVDGSSRILFTGANVGINSNANQPAPEKLTVGGNISASGTIIGNTATFSNYRSPGNVGTMLIDQIISSSTNVLSVGDFNGSNAGVRMELNQSTNKVEVKNADLFVGVADSNIQSLVVTNHITASGNISCSY